MSRIATRHYVNGSINAIKLTDELKQGKYAWQRMDHQPSCSAPNGYGDPTGTTGDLNRALFRYGLAAQYHVKGTQTLLAPLLDNDKGLDISQDQTDNDGVEYVFGGLGTNGPFTFTVGTDNCFIRVKFRIADVSGTDDCAVGFRKNEAMQANIDDYDEAAFLNVILGVVKAETILNNAATTTTTPSSTSAWADDATHELMVKVIGRSVSFFYDGSPCTGLPAFSFDSGEVIVPFFFFLQATTTPGKVWWKEVEVGLLKTINSTGIAS